MSNIIGKDSSPLVSVLMTCYNREQYIAGAIESVLSSSYRNWELIIVDDQSTDNTLSIAESFAAKDNRIKVYRNEQNLGDYPNRNKAASYAKGKYLKYLDSDDLIYYYGLEVMVNYMERFPEAGFGLASIVENERPFPILISPQEIYLESFYGFDHFGRGPGSSIIKREAFEKLGGFSGKRMIGDMEFWMKCARYYPMVKYPFDLYWNRLHEVQESQTQYAKKNYPKMRNDVYEEALSHPECPLNKEQAMAVRSLIRRREIKNKLIKRLSSIKKKFR